MDELEGFEQRTVDEKGPILNGTECETDAINVPSEPITLIEKNLTRHGKDVELDFESSLNQAPSEDVQNEDYTATDRHFLRDQYLSGLWAPHPQFFLPNELLGDEEQSVFTRLKSTMKLITDPDFPYYYIYKTTIQEGSGVEVRNDDIVVLHYAVFLDEADEPVDVANSRAMRKPLKFQLSQGNALPGFENAVRSMSPGETAYFIVSSSLAYGKLGCPPRYPPDAEIFYFIELVSVPAKTELEKVTQLTSEEREQLTFEDIKKVVHQCSQMLKFFYGQYDFKRALYYARWTVDLLEHCHVADEKEDVVRNGLLRDAYLNAAVIAKKAQMPKSVLYHTGILLKTEPKCKKALYLRIEGHLALEAYEDAMRYAKRANSLYPSEPYFQAQTERIKAGMSSNKAAEQELCRKMLGLQPRSVTLTSKLSRTVEEEPEFPLAKAVEEETDESCRRDLMELMADHLKDSAKTAFELDLTGFSLRKHRILDMIMQENSLCSERVKTVDGKDVRRFAKTEDVYND